MTRFTMTRRQAIATTTAAATLAATGTARAAMLPGKITDAQVHIWIPGEKQPSPNGRQEPFSAEQLFDEMDSAGVDRAVVVTPSWNADGNGYPLRMAEKYPDRLKVMGLAGMPKPDQKEKIETWMSSPGMAGIRFFLSFPPGDKWMREGSDWIWPILAEKNIPVMIHAGLSLDVIAGVAEKFPNLPICLDAFGLPTRLKGRENNEKFPAAAAMAKYPNIVMKTGAIPYLSAEDYPWSDMKDLVKMAYDAYGPDRLIFASDITLLKVPYKQSVDWWGELDFLSDADLAKIMGGNVSNFIGWPEMA